MTGLADALRPALPALPLIEQVLTGDERRVIAAAFQCIEHEIEHVVADGVDAVEPERGGEQGPGLTPEERFDL